MLTGLMEEVKREWPIVQQTPLLFISAVSAIVVAVSGACWFFFKEILKRQTDLIQTLRLDLDHKAATVEELTDKVSELKTAQPLTSALQVLPTEFALHIERIEVARAQDRNSVRVALTVTIHNSGEPSLCLNWNLYALRGREWDSEMPPAVSRSECAGPIRDPSCESLDSRLRAAPLGTGKHATGVITFEALNVGGDPDIFEARLELSVSSLSGRRFAVSRDYFTVLDFV